MFLHVLINRLQMSLYGYIFLFIYILQKLWAYILLFLTLLIKKIATTNYDLQNLLNFTFLTSVLLRFVDF